MTYQAPTGTRVGHIHLRVSDLDRSIAFYTQVMGFEVQQRIANQAAFLSAGGYHHHIGLNTWDSAGGQPAPRGHTGLYHVAFLYPDRASLGQIVGHVIHNGVQIDGAADHGVSEAIYFNDPDGNGIEVYVDRPIDQWPRNDDGTLRMVNAPLDVAGLVDEYRLSKGA